MSNPRERIGVYYSHGHNFSQVLHGVRRHYPEAEILAIVPKDYVLTSAESDVCDRAIHANRNVYPVTAVTAILQLLRQIRELECTLFVVLFKTDQLRIFAAMAGADRCECWGVDSRIHALDATFPSAALHTIARASRGWARLIRLWLHAHLVRIRAAKPSDR